MEDTLKPLPPFRVRALPRTLLFKRPAGTSRGVYTERRVWYVLVTSAVSGTSFTGLGECAPLPDLSCDYDNRYGERLREVCAAVERAQCLDGELLRDRSSMLFGLETAFRSAEASLRRCDYRRLFPSDFTEGRRGIEINGLVWMGSCEEMSRRMEEKLEAGFRCVKLKIGAIDFESELSLIKKLRARYSADTVELRVDANGAFSPAEAPRRLEELARHGIHSIEQPIRQGQWEEMARLCASTPVPVALDEELIGVNNPAGKAALLDAIRPQYIIIKPSLHGGLAGAAEWMRLARERGVGYWTTSALESNVGLNAIAQWCAWKGLDLRMPQGLGTGRLFVRNYDNIPLSLEGSRLWYGGEKQRAFRKEVAGLRGKWRNGCGTMEVRTSGSTGKPKLLRVEKERMRESARRTIAALGLRQGVSVLVAMPLRYIAGQMMVVRSELLHSAPCLVAAAPSSHPYAALHEAPYFAALTPMQVYESLKVPHERSLLRRTRRLIIGGGPVPPELERELKTFPHPVWATYGMTETLSHIALRRLNGSAAATAYTPLPGVEVSLSAEGTLCVYAPWVNAEKLVTNDLAEIFADGTFRVTGRRDNVICSGGVKLRVEEVERKLAAAGFPVPFQITASPDARLGEAVTLLYEGGELCAAALERVCREALSPYEVPRRYIAVAALPQTETGKPARAEARRLAGEPLKGNKQENE